MNVITDIVLQEGQVFCGWGFFVSVVTVINYISIE